MMEKKCKYTETYDPATDSLRIINEDGCEWENGVGYAPDNSFCGECTLICAEACVQRTLIQQHLQEHSI